MTQGSPLSPEQQQDGPCDSHSRMGFQARGQGTCWGLREAPYAALLLVGFKSQRWESVSLHREGRVGLWPNPRITDVPASPLECRPGRPLPMGEGAAPEGSGEHCPLLEVGAQVSPRLTSQSRGGGARGPVNGAHLWGRGSGVGRRVPALRPLWQESPSGWSAHAHTHLLIRHQPPALPSVHSFTIRPSSLPPSPCLLRHRRNPPRNAGTFSGVPLQ